MGTENEFRVVPCLISLCYLQCALVDVISRVYSFTRPFFSALLKGKMDDHVKTCLYARKELKSMKLKTVLKVTFGKERGTLRACEETLAP